MRFIAFAPILALAACGGSRAVTPSGGSTGSSSSTGTTGTHTGSGGTTTGGGSTTTGGTTGGGCPRCPVGYSCGSANGTAVCRAPSGIPLFSHVFVIPMENFSLSTLQGSDGGYSDTPYLAQLAARWATASDYHGVAHPSLPNYIALTSGDVQGDVESIGCDCQPSGSSCNSFNCSALSGSCGCPQAVPNLADDLEDAGIGWRAYAEDMGSACNLTASGSYAPKHVPFLYYQDIQSDAARCSQHDVDYGSFAADLAAGPPRFSFITPNLTDDMHDPACPQAGSQNLQNGDSWLQANVPAILASPAFGSEGLTVIVWDEDDCSGFSFGGTTDDPIGLFVISPLAKGAGYVSAVHADHYSLLATIEDGLGLPRLGKAAQATPLTDFFPSK